MTAPTPVIQAATAWNSTTTPKTATVSVQAGDVLVAYCALESGQSGASLSVSDTGGNTWTKQRENSAGVSSGVHIAGFTAEAAATGSITVSFARVGGTGGQLGGVVEVWRGGSVGATAVANNGTGSGAPSVSITTTGANSALSAFVGDWNATSGTGVWTTAAGTPTTVVDTVTTQYGVHSAYYADVGAAGSKTIGMSSPATQRYGIIAIEIQGTAGGTDGTASGATLTATASLAAGSAAGIRNATAVGATLTSTAALLAGSASGVRNGAASGAILTAAASLIAGSASGGSAVDGTATGATLAATASLIAGTATGTASGIMVVRHTTAGQFIRSAPPSSGTMAHQSTIAGQLIRVP